MKIDRVVKYYTMFNNTTLAPGFSNLKDAQRAFEKRCHHDKENTIRLVGSLANGRKIELDSQEGTKSEAK